MSMDVSRLKRRALSVREEPVMHEGGYLIYCPAGKLGEAFVVAQLVEEIVAANDDELPP